MHIYAYALCIYNAYALTSFSSDPRQILSLSKSQGLFQEFASLSFLGSRIVSHRRQNAPNQPVPRAATCIFTELFVQSTVYAIWKFGSGEKT